MAASDDQSRIKRPGPRGGMLHTFAPGVSGNPGGVPKGFVPSKVAMESLLSMPIEHVRMVHAGIKPPGWGDRPVAMAYVLAAGQILSGSGGMDAQTGLIRANAPNADVVYDRTEGKVAQRVILEAEELAKKAAEAAGVPLEEVKRILGEIAK